jgi:hypothetical protein
MKTKLKTEKSVKPSKIKIISAIDEFEILIESAKVAAAEAITSSEQKGLTIKFIKNNKIISVSSDGEETIEKEIIESSLDTSRLRKGMILKRK